MLMILGLSVLWSNPDEPYSKTIPIVLGRLQLPVGVFLVVCALFIAFSLYGSDEHEKTK